MGKTFESLLTWCTAACAFVIASSFSTARADPRAASNIPTAEPKSDAAELPVSATELPVSATELPLPYESWRGSGHSPPAPAPERDAPAPLARARELPRRSFELSAAFMALLPSCGAGSVDDRGCLTVRAGGGIDVAFLYRATPFFAVGLEGVASGFGGADTGALGDGGGRARFGGIVGRLYFADAGAWDPYAALTLGAGTLTLPGNDESQASVETSGMGGRVAGGIDYLLGSRFRVGPTASFAHWIAWSEQQCAGKVCRDQRPRYGRLLGFATLGVRLTGSFGANL
jgi:hypothetical protein